VDARSLAHQREQVDLALGARRDADRDDPAGRVERLQVLRQVRRPDELENHVERPMPGKALRRDRLRSERLHVGTLLLATHRRRNTRARRFRELDRRSAHPAGSAMNEQALAGSQLSLREERVVRSCEHLRQAPGLRPVEAPRDRHQLALVDDCELSLATAADDRHHTIAHLEAFGA
jgi:hypothetical protein